MIESFSVCSVTKRLAKKKKKEKFIFRVSQKLNLRHRVLHIGHQIWRIYMSIFFLNLYFTYQK